MESSYRDTGACIVCPSIIRRGYYVMLYVVYGFAAHWGSARLLGILTGNNLLFLQLPSLYLDH